ncbi:MAG: Maf family protein [Eubacteriales bacterium]|nr:Maf family protein [Eubacteriales bacterium]
MGKIILASTSPRRIELLKKLNMDFKVQQPGVEEESFIRAPGQAPEDYAMDLALLKAESVLDKTEGDSLIIGADTVVTISGKVLGKPSDSHEARLMLESLQGKCHEVITGLCVINAQDGRRAVSFEKTRVRIRNLTDQEITFYISTGESLDKAGAYGVQSMGALLVERIEGCYFNVVGLPIYRLSVMLREFGYDLLS